MEIDSKTRDLVARALAEDVGGRDLTAEAVVPPTRSRPRRSPRNPRGAVWAGGRRGGLPPGRGGGARGYSARSGSGATTSRSRWRESGPARALLSAERTALNFLGHLSGVATPTARFVGRVKLTGARILDTRKTTPGLRALEKAAAPLVAG